MRPGMIAQLGEGCQGHVVRDEDSRSFTVVDIVPVAAKKQHSNPTKLSVETWRSLDVYLVQPYSLELET